MLSAGDVLPQLRRYNPWWRSADWPREDNQLRALSAAPFAYDPRPLAGVSPGNVYLLLGPRRVGKSTAVKRAIQELLEAGHPAKRVVYFSCDLVESARELAGVLLTVYDEARAGGSLEGDEAPFSFFLDEVQRVPEWQQAVKNLHDTDRLGRDCLVLTGSSARDLRTGGELLPGRRGRALDRDRLLLPMSFRDFVAATAPDLRPPPSGLDPADLVAANHADSAVRHELTRPRTAAVLADLVDRFDRYLRVGGFPGAVTDHIRDGDVSLATIRELWDVLRGDLNRFHQVRDPTIPLKVLERLSLNLASPVSWSKIAREADVDVKTVQSYVELFTDAHLFVVVHRWDGGSVSRVADKKVYPIDPLVAQLASVVNGRERFRPEPTELAEAMLAVGLLRTVVRDEIAAFGVQQALVYHRTGTGKEVDFLVGRQRLPFESKYGASVDRRDAQVMEQSFGRGVLCTRTRLDLDGRTVLIPSAVALAMLA